MVLNIYFRRRIHHSFSCERDFKSIIMFFSFYNSKVFCIGSLLLGLSSCINPDYDLSKDINWDITIGGSGISFPLGNTEPILLNNLIGESDLIKIDSNGHYSIVKSGQVRGSEFKIDPISFRISSPVVDPVNVSFRIFSRKSENCLSDLAPMYPSVTAVFEANFSTQTQMKLKQKVPKELTSFRKATLRKGSKPKLKVKIAFPSTFPKQVDRLTFINTKVILPNFVKFLNEDIVNGVLTLNESFNPHLGYEKELIIDHFDFSSFNNGEGLKSFEKNGENYILIDVQNEIRLLGYVRTENVTISLEDIQETLLIPTIEIDEVLLDEVSGLVNPEIDPIRETVSIELDNDLDFLKTDASLNLHDPQFTLKVGNTIGVPLNMLLKLEAKDAYGEVIPNTRVVEVPIRLNPAQINGQFTYTNYIISKQGTLKAGYQALRVPELSDLLTVIPDQITIDLLAEADLGQEHVIGVGSDMLQKVSGEYEVIVPLRFETIKINYVKTIANLQKAFADIQNNPDTMRIELKMQVANTVPLALFLSAEGYDQNRNLIKGIKCESMRITPGDGTQKPIQEDLTLILSVAPGLLSDLDQLDLKIHANGGQVSNDVILQNNQYVQLNDIRIKLLGGITVDVDNK